MSDYPLYLIHYGIQGQKWGVRRFQNEDGTYTSEGLERRRKMQEDYDRGKLQGAHVRNEIKRLGRAGKEYAKYNESLAKQQKMINRRFVKVTGKIERDKAEGKDVSQRRINKAIKLGTEFRKRDYIAKDPDYYYDQAHKVKKFARTTGFIAGGLGGVVYGVPLAMGMTAVRATVADKKINDHYQKVFEQARNETVKDLKKHKIL